MKPILPIITLLTFAVAVTTTGLAEKAGGDQPVKKKHPGHHGPGQHRHMPLIPPRLIDKLQLTADQQATVSDLGEQWATDRDKWLDEHKETKNLRDEMKAAREAGDQEKITELRQQMRDRMSPLHEMRKGYMEKVKAVLNDDQKRILVEAMQQARENWKKHPAGKKRHKTPPAQE